MLSRASRCMSQTTARRAVFFSMPVAARFSHSPARAHKVAVILSGCGVYDGSEVTEAVAALVCAHKAGLKPTCYAPDMAQHHVVNHLTGEEQPDQTRNVLEESARIARGEVSPLSKLEPGAYDALIVPGGFGAAKNLSSFAFDGDQCKVHPEVEAALRKFHELKKPIAAACISPVLLAKLIPDARITMGSSTESPEWPHAGAAQAATSMGATHVDKSDVRSTVVDDANKLITAPAYMCSTTPDAVFDSIDGMVGSLAAMLRA